MQRRAKHSHEEDQAQGAGTATRRTKLKEQAQPRRGPSSRSMQMVTTQGLERQEPKELSLIKGGGAVSKESTPGHEEEEQCRRSRHSSRGTGVSGPDIDRTEGSSPLRSGDHFKHQVNTLDTRVDATNLITNTINLIIIDATNLITNTINLIIIDITNLITNTINLIIINTHTRPWCHHNIDIDRAELPLNGVSTEYLETIAVAQFDSHRVSRQTDLGFRRETPDTWFKFNQVYEQSRMINHMGAQLEGTAREWWTSKLRIDRAREGRLFNDWHYFTERLSEQFNPRNARMEAYNKLLALRLTSDTPGAATRHVERFRDLEGQVNLDDNELVIDLFRGSLTRSIQEKFERNPPGKRWEWYREVEEIDRQRMLLQQSSARHSLPNATSPPLRTGSRPNQSSIPI
ncbi:hypothetical protein NDA14_000008 [Ustilago hordei]|nr:hypothetical protein NDA14_000008 [Ustilago hordei]